MADPKERVIEVDFKASTPKDAPKSPVQRRLESRLQSPHASPTKEQLDANLQKAEKNRQELLDAKKAKAAEEFKRAQELAEKKKNAPPAEAPAAAE
mmetsp:Transcript_13994/g.55182  ORF Transcript_13994/g.55182 Transcript_13994/m.55182 type:complete len:96 (+) Transcript_13994:78-365(+)